MPKFKIVFERPKCIGAFACLSVAPKYWSMADDGKVDLIGGKEVSPGVWEVEMPEEDLAEMDIAAKSCPVNVIHITNLDTGEQLV